MKTIVVEPNRSFYIARSAIVGAGRGLFARTALAAGSRLEVEGTLIRANSLSDRSTRYADAYKFRIGEFLLIPMGFGGMLNHSATPNMEKNIRGTRLYMRALHGIEKGAELLFTYSKYAQKRFGLE